MKSILSVFLFLSASAAMAGGFVYERRGCLYLTHEDGTYTQVTCNYDSYLGNRMFTNNGCLYRITKSGGYNQISCR